MAIPLLFLSSGASPPQTPLVLEATLGDILPAVEVCRGSGDSLCQGLDLGTVSGKMRAQGRDQEGLGAELDFLYLGPSESVAPLASGELRRQVGLKLLSQDSCNVLYVMWRIEPSRKAGLVVSLKRNPGLHEHEACGTGGYRNISPAFASRLPPLKKGSRHRLRAILDGGLLRVWVDDELAWRGRIDPSLLDFRGPVGIRTDNGRFAFSLRRSP